MILVIKIYDFAIDNFYLIENNGINKIIFNKYQQFDIQYFFYIKNFDNNNTEYHDH